MSALNLSREKKVLQRYYADGIYAISQSMANAFGGQVLSITYDDLFNPQEIDTRTEEEVVEGIEARLKAM